MLVQEYANGGTLSHALSKLGGPMPEKHAVLTVTVPLLQVSRPLSPA